MPELPEVETVVRYIRPHLVERSVVRFTAHWPKVTAPASPEEFTRQVTYRTIKNVRRRGKYIILELDQGYIHLHLRMTGRLQVLYAEDCQSVNGQHVTARFDLSDQHCLVFNDIRKFGRVGYLDDLNTLEARLGPEPLSRGFTPQIFYDLLHGRTRRIKPLLLDQAFVSGLGNIYVDEALFRARIHPEMPAMKLTLVEAAALHQAIRNVLSESIRDNGTTIINFQYGEGNAGRFREKLRVFRHDGEPCPVCGTTIKKTRVAQRGTYLCPSCQH